jgi:hypothetical protein
MVPREWLDPPDHDSAEGMLLEDNDYELEISSTLGERDRRPMTVFQDDPYSPSPGSANNIEEGNGKRSSHTRDTSGRALPESERAPTLHEVV